MMRILVHNQKGGVGKTTTTANLGAALLRGGHVQRVVLADLDPQMHLTAMFLDNADPAPDWTVSDWLQDRPGTPVAVEGEPGLFLIPGDAARDPAQPVRLGESPQADCLIMDSAPAWDTHMAQLAVQADIVLCPLEPDFLGLSGVGRLLARLDDANVPRDRVRLLICRYSPRLAVHREVRARLAQRFGPQILLPVAIRNTVRLAEAPGLGVTIFSHAPTSVGASDHALLAAELASAAQYRSVSK